MINYTLITGVAGTTGSGILDILSEDPDVIKGTRIIIGIDDLSRGTPANILKHLSQRYFIFIESKWQNKLAYLSRFNIDEIYHMAAIVPTHFFYDSPDLTFKENCQGTIDLFDWARGKGVRRFITGSSSEIYGHISNKDLPAKETTMSHFDSEESTTRWSYAEGKLLTEHYLNHFKDHMERVCHLRFANTYGVRDMDDNHIIPYLVNRIVNNEEVHINKNAGLYCRTFLNNKDSARACVELMKKGRNGVAYNVGSDKEIRIEDLLRMVIYLAIDLGVIEDYDFNEKVYYDVSRSGDPERRILDTHRLYEDTGFLPEVTLEEGIKEMILYAAKKRKRF